MIEKFPAAKHGRARPANEFTHWQKPVVLMRLERSWGIGMVARSVEVDGIAVTKAIGTAAIDEMDALLEVLAEKGSIQYDGQL